MVAKLKKREKSKNFQTIFSFALVGLAVLSIAGFFIFQNIKVNQQRVKLTEIELLKKQRAEEVEKKREFLKAEIAKIDDKEYIEKLIREELNLQKGGEQAVAFVLPEKNEEEKEQEGNFWSPQTWWNWLKSKF